MTATETSKLRTIAGVIGVGSLALFGATACDDGGTAEEEAPAEEAPAEEEPMEEEPMEEDPAEESPAEEETMEEEEEM
ncbi:hypothetical protein [Nesterenkonia lutea]|uniref:Uncharacterized protein n=1 Tax=Nesterenkonia lutea TaxID=272919 RepID=A0ABR9JCP7_9MICC|nr:hypothetical protein [Nesterenkonia lutea]MBE1523257.1 hypothetical protein [Nesterenkonia lutea]